MFILFLGIFTAYLIGSVPTAYIFGRVLKGIDIRRFGSGNVGAANTLRVIGRLPGLIVLIIDAFKGFVCTTYIATLFMHFSPVPRPELYRVLTGLAAIVGHNWTVFLKFRGGKGVATSSGVMMALMPKIFCLGLLVWCITFSITGFISVASIISSISVPVFTLVFGEPAEIVIFASLLCLIIVYRHRSNIHRLRNGQEKRMSLFK